MCVATPALVRPPHAFWALRIGPARRRSFPSLGQLQSDHFGIPGKDGRRRQSITNSVHGCTSSCSSVLIGTKRMICLVTASAMAFASMKSFLFDFQ